MMRRRKPEPAVQAKLAELHRRVFPPEPTDVASLVRAELAAERERQAQAAAEADEARFTGGPCWACGSEYSAVAEWPDTEHPQPGWRTHPRGSECGTCHGWKHYGFRDDTWLLDTVATILLREGLEGLAHVNRTTFPEEPGLAEKMGVKFWCDVPGAPTGSPWLHLAGTKEAYQAECDERDRQRAVKLADVARREREWAEQNPPPTIDEMIRAEQARRVLAGQPEPDRGAKL